MAETYGEVSLEPGVDVVVELDEQSLKLLIELHVVHIKLSMPTRNFITHYLSVNLEMKHINQVSFYTQGGSCKLHQLECL